MVFLNIKQPKLFLLKSSVKCHYYIHIIDIIHRTDAKLMTATAVGTGWCIEM